MLAKYKKHFKNKDFIINVLAGVFLLVASMIIGAYAGHYATESASNPVTDIILNNVPVFDVDGIFLYGPLIFWLFVTFLFLKEPKRIPFILKSVALFVLIRSLFVTLTHIGPFPDQSIIHGPQNFFESLMFGGDLFFSGHTGLPFLLALIFAKDKRLLVLFTAIAIFFGIVVLLGHLHYSIDVLAAFFITYTIYHIACWLFKKDKGLFDSAEI